MLARRGKSVLIVCLAFAGAHAYAAPTSQEDVVLLQRQAEENLHYLKATVRATRVEWDPLANLPPGTKLPEGASRPKLRQNASEKYVFESDGTKVHRQKEVNRIDGRFGKVTDTIHDCNDGSRAISFTVVHGHETHLGSGDYQKELFRELSPLDFGYRYQGRPLSEFLRQATEVKVSSSRQGWRVTGTSQKGGRFIADYCLVPKPFLTRLAVTYTYVDQVQTETYASEVVDHRASAAVVKVGRRCFEITAKHGASTILRNTDLLTLEDVQVNGNPPRSIGCSPPVGIILVDHTGGGYYKYLGNSRFQRVNLDGSVDIVPPWLAVTIYAVLLLGAAFGFVRMVLIKRKNAA